MTEDELRALIRAMIDMIDKPAIEPSHSDKKLAAAIDAVHAARKRHPIEWPPEAR